MQPAAGNRNKISHFTILLLWNLIIQLSKSKDSVWLTTTDCFRPSLFIIIIIGMCNVSSKNLAKKLINKEQNSGQQIIEQETMQQCYYKGTEFFTYYLSVFQICINNWCVQHQNNTTTSRQTQRLAS